MRDIRNEETRGRQIRTALISVFCVFIATCVIYVMFNVYTPSQNALGALSSVCLDVICIIILFILISSFALNRYGGNKTTRIYVCLLVANIWAVFLDFLNWSFDGSLEFGHLTFWFTAGSLCMGAILACIFVLYLDSYMEETHKLRRMHIRAKICAIINIVSFVVTAALALTGAAFEFVDGHYEVGELYDVVTIIPVVTLLYLTCYFIRNVKIIGGHDVFAVAGYILFMIAGALIETEYRIGTTYVAVSLADMFIFVMLQNEIIALEKRNVLKWMKKSNMDELTGFYNRNAYEADVTALDLDVLEDDFVYVSADVNSLKNINDTLGHSAGDELIIGASECLNNCLGAYGKLYRIGGDEFIALINLDAEKAKMIPQEIEKETKKWNGKLVHNLSISCGYVSKKDVEDMSVTKMAILADKRMYEAKNEYYRSSGLDRRKR